jgi:transcription-repair coupling factor (superfamily II helicase)
MNLLAIALLKADAHKAYIMEIANKNTQLCFKMYPKADIWVEKIPELIASMQRRLRFLPGSEPAFAYEPEGNLLDEAEKVTKAIQGLRRQEGELREK